MSKYFDSSGTALNDVSNIVSRPILPQINMTTIPVQMQHITSASSDRQHAIQQQHSSSCRAVVKCNSAAVLPVFSAKHPPCRVCDGRGSGIHYGVNTCEACKGFFGRCLSRNNHLKCKNSGNCIIVHGQRHCSACRLKKCLKLGMSKDYVKIGRNNYIQVTQAIEEVKRLELQLKLRRDGTLVSPEEHRAQMDYICDKIMRTHFSYCPHSADFYADLHRQEQLFLERNSLEEQLFGRRRIVSRSEYNEIYKQTKIDVDGRRALVKSMLPVMQQAFDNCSIFAKSIMGYNQLSKNDQRELLKFGVVESAGMLYHSLYNTDDGVFVYPYDTSIVMKIESMLGYTDNPECLYDSILKQICHAQQLELTNEETVLAGGLYFLLADAELSTIGRKIVNSSADSLGEALYRLLQKNHDDSDRIYAKIILIYYDGRQINKDIKEHMRNVVVDSMDLNLPKDFVDLYLEEDCDGCNVECDRNSPNGMEVVEL